MRLTRIAVAAAAGLGLALLGTAPAAAESAPVPFNASISPAQFQPGDELTITAGPCDTAPTVSDPDGVFAATPNFQDPESDGEWTASAATKANLQPGEYDLAVNCGEQSIAGTVTVADQPDPQPEFSVDVNPKVFQGGDTLTFTAKNCPTVPTLTDVNDLFVGSPKFTQVNETTHEASATTKSNLVDGKTYKVVVTCEGVDKVTFSTNPGEPVQKDDGQTSVVPEGGVDTGDGSTAGGAPVMPLLAGATAVALAGAVFGFAARRRVARQEIA